MKQKVHNDEPSSVDSLNRLKYAKAFANLTLSCETPMVVGLYGSWGTGKSTLMKLIQENLNKSKTIPIWFDPWQHQFDENPTLALVHTIIEQCEIKDSKKLATIIASALGVSLLKTVSNVSIKDIEHLARKYEEENFLLREERVKLKEYFSTLIDSVIKDADKRVVFFIDDLDRCMPEQVMKLLESLKLFLNLPNCVYFLAVDHEAIEQSIEYYYNSIDIKERNYLDKIVQLPFNIPPVYNDSISDYITPLLPIELLECRKLLIDGLSGNPRELKRFINTLIFNHELSKESQIEDYDPRVLTAILLMQSVEKELFKIISNNPKTLIEYLGKDNDTPHGLDSVISEKSKIKAVLSYIKVTDERILGQYLYQTRLLSTGSDIESVQLDSILSKHKLWIDTQGNEGEVANISKVNMRDANLTHTDFSNAIFEWSILSGANFSYSNLTNANLKNIDAANCTFEEVIACNIDLENSKVSGSEFKSFKFYKSNFLRAELKNASMFNVEISESNCRSISLEKTVLNKCKFIDSDFTGANLKYSNFESLDFEGCDFTRVNFSFSQLNGKDFSNMNLSDSILYKCDLSGTKMIGSDLSNANLSYSILSDCDMSAAILYGADLTNVKGLTREMIESALFDESTRLDKELEEAINYSGW
ncbi:P-loop NTPase fold protein [Vibrio parahaemolyticus]|nr:pentapeptide repeat-containing protein [Vibrio parahaemolyticus]